MDFSSTKIQMISRIQYLPLLKQESFLRKKYEAEKLSVNQIAALTFSSRSTVVKYLNNASISLRLDDRTLGLSRYGFDRTNKGVSQNAQEQTVIQKAKDLRNQGFSFQKIASIMNTMGIKTKSKRSKWYAKTVRVIILR